MIRLLTMVVLLSLSSFGWASVYPDKYEGVPNTFKDGDIIKAEDFNNNNLSIKKAINDIPAGATGPAGADGADGVAAGLSCTPDQIIKWNGLAWVCANPTGPQLTQVIFDCTDGDSFLTPATCSASCADQVLVSGGCSFNYLDNAIFLVSRPNGNSWLCGIGDNGPGSYVDSAYAICQ